MAKPLNDTFESPWVMTLHTGMMFGVVIQLISSQLMHSHISHAVNFFYLHRLSGVWTFMMVLLYIMVKAYRGTLWDLYPWHRHGVCAMVMDIKYLCKGRIPVRKGVGLARFVQGLGVLVVLAMGALGVTWWTMKVWHWGLPGDASRLLHWHATIATLLWIYVVGHVAMALLHWVFPKNRLVELS